MIRTILLKRLAIALFAIGAVVRQLPAAEPTNPPNLDLFRKENLVAWCIVPFDAKKRTPTERAEMLQRLGFSKFAYDWRAEHLPTFDDELRQLKTRNIEFSALWFPRAMNGDAQALLNSLEKHGIKTQLWVTGSGGSVNTPEEQRKQVVTEADRIRPIAQAAARIGCTVALYNHGGWFGEPENQLAIIEELKLPNVGIVYNQHHGHDHIERFPKLLKLMMPHLLALNLNGMEPAGDRQGKKILPLGQGSLDLGLLKIVAHSGYRGPIGILGHTQDDAEERLQDNLDGLNWLIPQLSGKEAGPKPTPRTFRTKPSSAATSSTNSAGYLASGRDEYREPPLTASCRVMLKGKSSYNILIASDIKRSGSHWELFTMPGSGLLTAYLPGSTPDHVRSPVDVADGKPHNVAMVYEPQRVRLFVDGKPVADQSIQSKGIPKVPGELAFARLVEGGIGCNGALDFVHLQRGVHDQSASSEIPQPASDTIGLWIFGKPEEEQVADLSPAKNTARRTTSSANAQSNKAPVPPPGVHLSGGDKLKVTLIDRSPNDVYMAVKADSQGRLFVGGREAVYVFEPTDSGYGPRRELLRFPQDSIIIGLELRGDDLYVLASSALYRIPGGRTQRSHLKPERILWGLPLDLHVSFHCLAWGPQGDLYLDHGDPLLNFGDWTRPDHWGHWTLFAGATNKPTPYTGQGSVLRVSPAGENPRVIATGLRGPVGLTFDKHWNLFSNDNDHESRADRYAPARLLHVTPQVDFAWPRGWMASKSADRADLIEPLGPDLGRGVPCDMVYYDEPLLPELRGQLLLCRWDRASVTGHALEPRGASFTSQETTVLSGASNARPVGIAVDGNGRLFVTSLYLAGNMASPYCASDLVMVTRADETNQTPIDSFDLTRLASKELWRELEHPAWLRRSWAHQEIVRRGGKLFDEAATMLTSARASDRLLTHLIWLVAARKSENDVLALIKLAGHQDADIRLQAIRALAEFPTSPSQSEAFTAALQDSSKPVQLAALGAQFDIFDDLPLANVVRLANSDDSYLRQTSTSLLAHRATEEQLVPLIKSTDEPTRLAGVLAAGRKLTVPRVDDVPSTQIALSYPKQSSFFKTQLRFWGESRDIDLSELGRIGSYTTAQRWAAAPHSPLEKQLHCLLLSALDDASDRVRLQAAYWLSLLKDQDTDYLVATTQRNVLISRLLSSPQTSVDKAWLAASIRINSNTARTIEQGPIDLSSPLVGASGSVNWAAITADTTSFHLPNDLSSDQACYLYYKLTSGTRQSALIDVKSDCVSNLWQNGTALGSRDTRSAATATQPVLVDLQPGGNEILVRLTSLAVAADIQIHVRSAMPVQATLPEKLDSAMLAERLRDALTSGVGQSVPEVFLSVDWLVEAQQGDASAGRRLFGTLGCAKCHAITADQKGAGAPSLTEARRRFTVPHLVESVLVPSKQIAEPFRATTLITSDGKVVTGLITAETADQIELLTIDAARRTIAKTDVEERKASPVSPMPPGLVKTPQELRDLLNYLTSDRPLPP